MRAFYQSPAKGRRTISPMRAARFTAIGLGVALAACAGNHPLGGASGTSDEHGAAGASGPSTGRPYAPTGPAIVVAPVAGDASAADRAAGSAASDGAADRAAPEAGASDGAAYEHAPPDGVADAGTPCTDASACARVPTSFAIGGDGPWQACALFNDGTIECWANGTAADAPETTPVRVPGVADATAISVGGENACALLGDGTVTCWIDTAGNADAPTGQHLTTPAAVSGLGGVTALAVGEMHSCAIVAGGGVKCWGVNTAGELGDGTEVDSATPVSVVGLTGASAITVGAYHSCALRAGGQVVCWGDDRQGELGNAENVSSTTPVWAGAITGALALSTSGPTTCTLLAGGDVLCWGELFTDDMTTSAFVPTIATNVMGATAVAAGPGFGCAVVATKVYCWGADGAAQLGDGQPKTFGPPTVVADVDPTAPLALAATLWRACALHADRRISCWGARSYFGTGMTTLDLVPALVDGL